MSDAKRAWFKADVDFLAQDTVAVLWDEFGPQAPLLLYQLFADAKKADMAGRPRGVQGVVSARASALARSVRWDASSVVACVARACEPALGLLEAVDGHDPERGVLRVRSLKRGGWEPVDGSGAARMRRSRASRI